MGLLTRWVLNASALYVTASLLAPGITIKGFVAALVAAAILGVVNAIVRPLALLFTLPLNVATLGCFTFVINALLFWLVAAFVPGFSVHGFIPALLGAIIMSVISTALSALIRH